MLNEMLSARHGFGRTFMVAMWLLGAVAAAQVVAVGWAVVTRPVVPPAPVAGAVPLPAPVDGVGYPQGQPAGEVVGGDPAAIPAILPENAAITQVISGVPGSAVDAAGNSVAPGPEVALPTAVVESEYLLPGPSPYPTNDAITGAAEVENPAHAITLPGAQRMMALALEYRSSGNMQAALRALRDANTLSPNHPRVLSELASTYSQMGLDDKAAEYWRSVYVLGPERAGAFYDLADMAMKGNQIDETTAVETVLSIGEIETIRGPDTAEGERVTLRIPILSRPGSAPDAADMAMLVYFYDTVNGGDFAPTTATTNEGYVSEPYDWQDGNLEIIEESYFQPVFTEVEKKELGERAYFGYIIELYYRDELQAVVAEPEELMGMKPGEPDAGQLQEIGDETSGPGAELFPKPRG